MLDQLQAALVGALVLIVPPLAVLIVAKIKLMKTELDAKYAEAKADLDAAFSKIRAHEDELGIKTTQDSKTKEQHVSRSPRSGQVGSVDPHPLDPQGGK